MSAADTVRHLRSQRRRLLLGLSVATLGGVSLLVGPLAAAADRGQGTSEGMTADQAAERVRNQTGGRVLRVDSVGDGYRVKVLTPSGEVREITVSSGRR